MCVCVKLLQSCTTFCDPMGCQAPLSMGFSRQEYWSGLPFPHPGDLPNPGIKHALAGGFFTTTTNWDAAAAAAAAAAKSLQSCPTLCDP